MVLTESNKQMLKQTLPVNPCAHCTRGIICCDCSEKQKYEEKTKPYKEAGVYDIACAIRRVQDLKQRIQSDKAELENIMKNIPEEIAKDIFNE